MNFKLFFYLGFMKEYLVLGIVLAILFALYVFFKTKRIFLFFKKDPKSKYALILRIILSLLIIPFCINIWAPSMILAFYVIMVSAGVDIVLFIIHLFTRKKFNIFNKVYIHTISSIIIFTCCLIQGLYGMNHIVSTAYEVDNNKTEDTLNICFISDLHYGSIQSPKRLTEKIDAINATHPDIIVLGGDITDERTTLEQLKECYATLGKLKAVYGIYYIYGNHDRQPYTTDYVNGVRTYTDEQLEETITSNGIHILCDEVITINNIVLVGRDDPGWENSRERKSLKELLLETDKTKYIIDLDHQPIDQEEAIQNGCSLELSGHTHGGQVFPFDVITRVLNTYCYGEYHVDSLTQIVSSGYTGWGWPVRNAGKCEYVTIQVK